MGKEGKSFILIVYLVLNIPLEVYAVGGRWRGWGRGDGGACSGWEDEKVPGDLGSKLVLRRVPRGQQGRSTADTVRAIPQNQLSFLICCLSPAEAKNGVGLRRRARRCINKASSVLSGWQRFMERKCIKTGVLSRENIWASVGRCLMRNKTYMPYRCMSMQKCEVVVDI